MSTPTTKVLMSAGNPSGRKLEELLVEIAEDLRVENDALEADPSPTSRAVRINNLGSSTAWRSPGFASSTRSGGST